MSKTLELEEKAQYRTRGEFGDWVTKLTRISWTEGEWIPDDNGTTWGAWDSDYGWMPNFNYKVEEE